MTRPFLALLVGVLLPSAVRAGGNEDIAFFEAKIRPVLVEHCYSCHSANVKKPKGKLLLDSRDGARKGGETGPAVVPGDLDKSLLIRSIRHQLPDAKMPKDKPQLAEAVIADFVRWVNRGAVFPATGTTKVAGLDWWSLKPLARPPLPKLDKADWARTPIDAFLLARLREKGLDPSKEADRRTLIRRATCDVIGGLQRMRFACSDSGIMKC